MNRKNAFIRLLSVLLVSVMLFGMFCFTGAAAGATFTYEDKLENGKLTVSVYIKNAADINIVEMQLKSYDESLLTFEKFDAKQTDLADQVLEGIHECNFIAEDSQKLFIAIWGWSLGTEVSKGSPILDKYHLVNVIFALKPGAEQQLKGKKITFDLAVMESEENRTETGTCTLTVGSAVSTKPEVSTTEPATKPQTPVTPAKRAIGDVDGDNEITSSDARIVLRASVGLDILTSEEKAAADVDNDGAITSSDARVVLRVSVGLQTFEDANIEHTHSYKTVRKEPTCTSQGSEKEVCTICGAVKSTKVLAAAHDYAAATCKDPKKCKKCGATSGEPTGIHSFSNGVCTVCNKAAPNDNTANVLYDMRRYIVYLSYDAAILETEVELYSITPKATVIKRMIDTVDKMRGYLLKIEEHAAKDQKVSGFLDYNLKNIDIPIYLGNERAYMSAAKTFIRQSRRIVENYNIMAKSSGIDTVAIQ